MTGRLAIALAAGAVLAAPAASAGPDRWSVLLGSHHTESAAWEELNPGVFVTWEGPVDWSLGAYRNSFGKLSLAGTAGVRLASWDAGDLSLFGGLAWYPGNGDNFVVHAGDVVPLVGLQLRQGNFFAQLMPGKMEPPEAIVTFGLTFPVER